MIQAIAGSGGKTTLLKKMAEEYRAEGKKVFVTTTTHMLIEKDTLITDDKDEIIRTLEEKGYVMAGVRDGGKIKALPEEVYQEVCKYADAVLVEADGSKGLPLKYPNDGEPVIPDNADEIIIVCGLSDIGREMQKVCHRPELVKKCLNIEDDTRMRPSHVQSLVTEGYVKPLSEKYPDKKIVLMPRHDGSLYERAIASLLKSGEDVSVISKEWFLPQPRLFICGAGHVAKELSAMAARLDFEIHVMDDRADLANRERFPDAAKVICDDYGNLKNYLSPGSFYVAVTPDHKADLQCVEAILPTEYEYLGMIGSKKKVAATFENLRLAGFAKEQIDSVFAPVGLSIGAVTPAEIAVSILAQIIREKNKKHAASADRALLEVKESGTLCVITAKEGSAPRGVGSMMFVGEEKIIGSVGGGEPEHLVIEEAKKTDSLSVREYILNRKTMNGLDMICGGKIQVTFIPI